MRRIAVLLVAAALALPAVAASPAGAASATVCARETGSATITPGLTHAAHDQTLVMNETFGGCAGGGVKTARATATLKYLAVTCLGLTKSGLKTALHQTIVWNTSASSTVTGTFTIGPRVGQATITGKITAGLFVGLRIKHVVSYGLAALRCTGLTSVKTLTIKGVTAVTIQ